MKICIVMVEYEKKYEHVRNEQAKNHTIYLKNMCLLNWIQTKSIYHLPFFVVFENKYLFVCLFFCGQMKNWVNALFYDTFLCDALLIHINVCLWARIRTKRKLHKQTHHSQKWIHRECAVLQKVTIKLANQWNLSTKIVIFPFISDTTHRFERDSADLVYTYCAGIHT